LKGYIQVNIPQGIYPGDTISGTMLLSPAGSTAKEQARNEASLNEYIVEILDKQTPVAEGDFTFTIPVGTTAFNIGLKSKTGTTLLSKQAITTNGTPPPSRRDLVAPTFITAGTPFTCYGSFDGKLGSSHAKFDGQEATKLAESPRTMVVLPPAAKTGAIKLDVGENSRNGSCMMNSLSVTLSQPYQWIWTGGQSEVTVKVYGTTGLKNPINLQLENDNPSIAKLDGGDKQIISIEPNTDGYSIVRKVKGLKSGRFTVRVSIMDPKHIALAE
jgi:hypothetical protein